MKKILVIFCLLFLTAEVHAEVKYIAEINSSTRAPSKTFYIYGGYDFHFAQNSSNSNDYLTVGFGIFLSDNTRMEIAYENMNDKYRASTGDFNAAGSFGFVNFIVDAIIPKEYQFFAENPLVPFVGFGFGIGTVDADLKNDLMYAYNFIGGVSLAMNESLSLQITYKYIKTLDAELETGASFAPSSHNALVALRLNF